MKWSGLGLNLNLLSLDPVLQHLAPPRPNPSSLVKYAALGLLAAQEAPVIPSPNSALRSFSEFRVCLQYKKHRSLDSVILSPNVAFRLVVLRVQGAVPISIPNSTNRILGYIQSFGCWENIMESKKFLNHDFFLHTESCCYLNSWLFALVDLSFLIIFCKDSERGNVVITMWFSFTFLLFIGDDSDGWISLVVLYKLGMLLLKILNSRVSPWTAQNCYQLGLQRRLKFLLN